METARQQGTEQAEPDPAETVEGFDIEIFEAWCKGCGICVAFCPRACLGQDEGGTPRVFHPEQCSGCGWCEIHCPDFAISVRPRTPRRRPDDDDAV